MEFDNIVQQNIHELGEAGGDRDILATLSDKIDSITSILDASTSAQTANNFVINTCSTDHSTLKETKSVMIQTDTTREVIEEVVEVHDHPTNVPSSSPAL